MSFRVTRIVRAFPGQTIDVRRWFPKAQPGRPCPPPEVDLVAAGAVQLPHDAGDHRLPMPRGTAATSKPQPLSKMTNVAMRATDGAAAFFSTILPRPGTGVFMAPRRSIHVKLEHDKLENAGNKIGCRRDFTGSRRRNIADYGTLRGSRRRPGFLPSSQENFGKHRHNRLGFAAAGC